MPEGQYLKDGKHNAKICKNPFLHIIYIYIYMVVFQYYKYYFKGVFLQARVNVNYVESVRFCNIFKALTGFEMFDKLLKRNLNPIVLW